MAPAADEQAKSESTSGNVTSEEEASATAEGLKVKKMMDTKVEGGKSAWAMTLETFGMSDGKKKKGDVVFDSFDECYAKFQELAKEKDWQFATTPFEDFQATKEDLFKAFVHWSRKGEDSDKKYNASKAFRRLEAYVEWMDKNTTGMNLKGSTMKVVHDAWKMKIAHDKDGRLVWWIDIGGLDLKKIKKDVSQDDTLRYFIWLSHLVLFDKGSQEHGFVFVEAIGKTGMMEMFTVVSMDVGTKLDRLTIGILPVKMEACYLFNNPTWMRIIMGLMSPFMGSKMRKRIVTLPAKKDPQEFFEANIGKEYIPTGVAQLNGTIEKDIIAQTLERLGA